MTVGNMNDRRRHERLKLSPMYTSITARAYQRPAQHELQGHAYDVSESGIRIELDEPLEPGEPVTLQMQLAAAESDVFAAGRVVWINDAEDDPGPRRMAIEFTEFLDDDDRFSLMRFLRDGSLQQAA
jgi:hypothetical protein